MAELNVSISEELKSHVQAEVATGVSRDESEVVEALLQEVFLARYLNEGLKDRDAGRVREGSLDLEEIGRRGRERLAKRND